MYDELSRKFRALESKMTQMKQAGGTAMPLTNSDFSTHGCGVPSTWNATPPGASLNSEAYAALQRRASKLEEELKQVKTLQEAYSRSEERCIQLVEVTQQWAIECDEKVKVIHLLEKEAEQLKVTVQQLESRVSKYKKFWMDTKDAPKDVGKVSDVQFEELRTELAMRRELYDQVREGGREARERRRGYGREGGEGGREMMVIS
jgi:molybdopterin converting factor small subunit